VCVLGVNCQQQAPLHRHQGAWKFPNVGDVQDYTLLRATGATIGATSVPVQVGITANLTFVDTEELPNGVKFTYFVRAAFKDTKRSGPSNFATVTAINVAPTANADSYTVRKNRTLTIAARGVLANDTDTDSPGNPLRAVLLTGPSHGTLVFNANGSFTYNPANGFAGTDTFTYKADDGVWSRDTSVALSPFSGPATVTITVN